MLRIYGAVCKHGVGQIRASQCTDSLIRKRHNMIQRPGQFTRNLKSSKHGFPSSRACPLSPHIIIQKDWPKLSEVSRKASSSWLSHNQPSRSTPVQVSMVGGNPDRMVAGLQSTKHDTAAVALYRS